MLRQQERSMTNQEEIDARARKANDPARWDELWGSPNTADWRQHALAEVYSRIAEAMPANVRRVVDIGGGQGDLAMILQKEDRPAEVWDHSGKALLKASGNGIHGVRIVNLEDERARQDAFVSACDETTAIVCTEVLEHLTAAARADILKRSADYTRPSGAFFSVPNARLSPDEEHQHTIEFTAITFAKELRAAFGKDVRVAVLGPYLLGFCGAIARKHFTLSMCLPVRDEEAELEKVLASFREVADEIVVGIDPRTVDSTREIAERYADVVFELDDPNLADYYGDLDRGIIEPDHYPAHFGLKDDEPRVPSTGVHFAWVRNQCMRRCSGDWVFMTEGHESLAGGHKFLLNLDRLSTTVGRRPDVIDVQRQIKRQRWAYPWICRNDPERFFYVRPTHNVLVYPPDAVKVAIPEIRTWHERDHANAVARAHQRQAQNRETLQDDWERMANPVSLFYLGQELRGSDPEKAAEHLEQYLEVEDGNGLTRYQARLMLAQIHTKKAKSLLRGSSGEGADVNLLRHQAGEFENKVRSILLDATFDDPFRTEHWIWLGDLAMDGGRLEEALVFYRYAGSLVGAPPFGPWWVDLDMYGYLPAQRLAMVYSHLGRGPESIEWARKVVEHLPDDAPDWASEEASQNLEQLEKVWAEAQALEA